MADEVWKKYHIDAQYDNYYELEISNWGRVKSFNSRFPEGKILKPHKVKGYDIIHVRLWKDRTPTVKARIQQYNDTVFAIEQAIKALRMQGLPKEVEKQKLEEWHDKRNKAIEKRKKYIHRTNLKRAVNYGFLIHKAVAEVFIPKPEGADFVIHKDFDKENNHADNLAWATEEQVYKRAKDNPHYIKAQRERKMRPRRKNRTNSKLEEKDVLYIKEKLKQGKTLRSLAQQFGVSDMQIHRIKTGENWGDLKTLEELRERKGMFLNFEK